MINKPKVVLIVFVVTCMFSSIGLKQDYRVFSTRSSSSVSIKQMLKTSDSMQVFIFGEEHDDSVAHILQLSLLTELHKKHGAGVVLSLEMFNREVQPIMDEYLRDLLKESYFKQDARIWSNYEDYEPLIKYAKKHNLEVICANAPFRYANLVSRWGMDSLNLVTNETKSHLPPLPYNKASKEYREKIEGLLGDHAKNDSTGYDLLRGQALWNASMAYWITEKIKERPEVKILHLNGRLHSDDRLGIVEHLNFYMPDLGSKCLTISSSKSVKLPQKVSDKDRLKADFVVYTKSN